MLICHQHDACENSVGSVYIGGYGGLSESGLCVFRELCPVSFLVVGECPSALPQSAVMSYVNCDDDGQVVQRQCVPSCPRCPTAQRAGHHVLWVF